MLNVVLKEVKKDVTVQELAGRNPALQDSLPNMADLSFLNEPGSTLAFSWPSPTHASLKRLYIICLAAFRRRRYTLWPERFSLR